MPISDLERLAAELRDAVSDHYDNGKMADPSILWHETGIPDAIDWIGAAEALLAAGVTMPAPPAADTLERGRAVSARPSINENRPVLAGDALASRGAGVNADEHITEALTLAERKTRR